MRRTRSLKNIENVEKKPTTLSDVMKLALLVHEDGMIIVYHDRAIPDGLEWVDFDVEEDKIYFLGKRGIPLDLGLTMKPHLKDDLMKCESLMAVHVENNDVQNMSIVPFLVRQEVEKPESKKGKK